MTKYIQRHPLISFVLINYFISWIFLYPCYQIILSAEEGTFPWLALIGLPGAYGPTIAAIIITAITEKKGAVRELLSKYLIWKIPFKWYVFALLVPVLAYTLALLLSCFWGYSVGEIAWTEGVKMYFVYLLLAIPFGPLGEELGWRGYFLPKLLEKFNILKSSLILGTVWTFWHLASFSFPGAAIPSFFEVTAFSILLYWAMVTAVTFVFTYLFLNTRGSVLLAILLHAAFNADSNIVLTFLPEVTEVVEQRQLIYGLHILVYGVFGYYLIRFTKF